MSNLIAAMTNPKKIIIHAGFHKTGTTTAQRFLFRNRNALDELGVGYFGKEHMKEYNAVLAQYNFKFDQKALKHASFDFAKQISKSPKSTILISNENLCGRIPGTKTDYHFYPYAKTLISQFIKDLLKALNEPEITLVFGVRNEKSWLKSAYVQKVKSERIVHELEIFSSLIIGDVDFEAIIEPIRPEIMPAEILVFDEMVHQETPWGLSTALLKLCGIAPQHQMHLKEVGNHNVSPSQEIIDQLLMLNRTIIDNKELAEEKKALMETHRKG